MTRYTVVLDPDPESGWYTVTVPALPGCVTEGASVADALANAQEAITGYVRALRKLGEPVPIEGEGVIVASVEIGELVPA